MKKIMGAGAIAALAALAVAGCGSAASSSPPAQQPQGQAAPAAAAPANPVSILKQAGAKVPPGVTMGDHDVFGDRMADGKLGRKGWEDVLVYTAATRQAYQALLARPGSQPDDYTGVITLPARHAVVVVSAWEDNGPHWAGRGHPAQIAQRVHGQLIRQ